MSDGSGYGSHPTIYGNLSDGQLYAMFRGDAWSRMDEGCRQQLLQETVNRSAASKGELGSCRVIFANLDPGTSGDQRGNTIRLNREMYVNDRQSVSYNGQVYSVPLPQSNMQALMTALHEDEHAFQNQLIEGVIQNGESELAREYAANNFSVVALPQEDGSMKLGVTYLQGETGRAGYYLYYFQSTERDAHLRSEQKTMAIMNALAAKYGDELSFQAFRQELAANGYQATLAEAQQLLGSKGVEREINQSLMNHYYGTNQPVDPKIEALVQGEMKASYEAIQQGAQLVAPSQTEKGDKMAINWHVSKEEYSAQLDKTVNMVYLHSINDPSLSREEAIRQSSETAEKALEAKAEFAEAEQAAYSAAEAASTTGESTGTNAESGGAADSMGDEGGGSNGGMDGGTDGGM